MYTVPREQSFVRTGIHWVLAGALTLWLLWLPGRMLWYSVIRPALEHTPRLEQSFLEWFTLLTWCLLFGLNLRSAYKAWSAWQIGGLMLLNVLFAFAIAPLLPPAPNLPVVYQTLCSLEPKDWSIMIIGMK